MEQTRELWETPATPDGAGSDLGLGRRLGKERQLLEWDFDAYVSRAGESWVDPLEFLIDDPTFGFGKPLLPLSLIDDRRHGWNRPIFQTEAQLAMIRGAARIVAQTAPMAIGALEALGNYVIGKGFTYEVADKANRQSPAGLSQAVQDVIDEFCDVNDWIGDRERELHNRVRRDGEAFTALYPDKNGIARTRFIEPERVTEPGNATDFEDWLAADVPLDWVFGVVTYASDIETVLGYHVLWNPEGTDFDFLPNNDLELALRLGSGLIAVAFKQGSSAPLTPTGLSVVNDTGNPTTVLDITWNASSGATSYTLLQSTTKGGTFSAVQTGISGTSTTVTGLTAGTEYAFEVEAVGTGGTSAASSGVAWATEPAAPTSISPGHGTTGISISFSPPTIGSNIGFGDYAYRYEHPVGAANWTSGSTSNTGGGGNGSPFNLSSLTPDTQYGLEMATVIDSTNSDWSGTIQGPWSSEATFSTYDDGQHLQFNDDANSQCGTSVKQGCLHIAI